MAGLVSHGSAGSAYPLELSAVATLRKELKWLLSRRASKGQRSTLLARRAHVKRFGWRVSQVSQCSAWNIVKAPGLPTFQMAGLLDERPMSVEDGVERSDHEPDSRQDGAGQARKGARAKDVDEHAVADRIRVVAGLMLQGIVEDEELAVLPVVGLVADLDVGVSVGDVIDVEEDAKCDAQRAEVFAGGLLFFGEKNGWQKLPAVLGVLIGIVLTVMG